MDEANRIHDLERELKERTERLREVELELEGFAYSVSHDLRAPLRAIEGFGRILFDDYAEQVDAEGKKYLEIITVSAARMQGMIDDLLAYSRLTRSQMARRVVEMHRVVEEVLAQVQERHAPRKVQVKIDKLPSAPVDPKMIRTVWEQLLENAFKFTRREPEPEVNIGGRLKDGEVEYFVHDNGVGFDMEYSGKLFRVFQKLHPPEEFEGTGIGLSIVKRIVQRHGGQLRAEGKTGEGATFSFSLPSKAK